MKPFRRSRSVATYPFLVVTLATLGASAQGGANLALAEELFQKGRALMEEKKFAEACPKLAESLRLDRRGGTLLALSLCHEGEGKLATAWAELNDVLAMARHDGKTDREKAAREHLPQLEAKISRLTIIVPEAARAPGLEVRLDGEAIGAGVWGTAVPVDPGPHKIEASAPGRVAWNGKVEIGAVSDAKTVSVPVLVEAPKAPVAAAPPPPATASPPPSPPPAPPREAPSRVPAYVALGVGGAGVAIGSITGLMSLSKVSDLKSNCPSKVGCDGSTIDSGKTLGTVSTIAFVLGAAGLGYGTYAILTTRSESVSVGVGPGSVAVKGAF